MAKAVPDEKSDPKPVVETKRPLARDVIARLDTALVALDDTKTKLDAAQGKLDTALAAYEAAVAEVEAAQGQVADLLADRLPGRRVQHVSV
jgi:exonuclease VII small subunit